MSSEYLLSQAIGIAGVICFIVSFQMKSNKFLFIMQCFGSLMMCLQFHLIGTTCGVFTMMLFVIRNFMLYKIDKWHWVRWKGWIWILCSISMIITILWWNKWYDSLTFIAMIGSTIGLWTNNAQKIRLCNIICVSPAWILFDVLVGAWAGVLNETIILGSIAISIYRFGWKNMNEKNEF